MLATCLAFLLAAAPSPDRVLLLGVRSKEGLATYAVDASGVYKVADRVLLPAAGGVWSVAVERSAGLDRLVVKGPDNRERRTTPPQPLKTPSTSEEPAACARPTLAIELLAASPDALSWEQTRDCDLTPEEEQAQADWEESMVHRPYDYKAPPFDDPSELVVARPASLDAPLGLAELGEPGRKALDRVLGSKRAGEPDEWALVRARGQWVVRVKARAWGKSESEPPSMMTLGPVAPASVIGPASPAGGFDAVARKHPGTLDALSSADGQLLVLFARDGLRAEAGGRAVGSKRLTSPALVSATEVLRGEPWLAPLLSARPR